MTQPDRSGLPRVILGGALISFMPVLVRVSQVGPWTAGFYRMLCGGLVLAGLALYQGQRLYRGPRQLALAALCGIFFSLDLGLWHASVFLAGPGLATVLVNCQVFFMAGLGAVILKEHPGPRLWLGIPLALGGILLLVGPETLAVPSDYRLGVVLGLLSAMAYAAYLFSLRHLQAREPHPAVLADVAVISLVTCLIMGMVALALGESLVIPTPASLLVLVIYGLSGQVLAWVLIARGLPHTPASLAGLALLCQPTLAFIWDVLVFSRPTSSWQWLGLGAAIAGIYLGLQWRAATGVGQVKGSRE